MQDPLKESHLKALAPRLLIVDDDPGVLRALRRVIGATHPQWRIVEATDGEMALEVMRDRPIHTLIADLQMPRMDGLTLLSEVAERYPNTLRIVHSSLIVVDAGPVEALAQAYIPKPVSPTSLISVLNWALGAAHANSRDGSAA